MESFATTSDIEATFRTLTDDETTVAESKLAFASAIIRQRFPDVDDRITAGTLSAELVKWIAVEAVVRFLRNPDAWRSESIEDYARTRDAAVSTGGIYLTADELDLLTAVPATTRGAFSITPYSPVPTYATYEAAATARARREAGYW